MADNVQASQLTDLAGQSLPDALARLRADGLLSNAAVDEALHLALTLAAAEPLAVTGWMHLLAAWAGATGDDPATTALLQYVRSRLALENGDFDAAETSLLSARATWQQIGDAVSLARSGLGLTQLLAMQGRFDEAESVIRASIAGLDAAGDVEAAATSDGQTVLLAMDARQNLATLLSYQERHAEALALTSDLRLALLDLLAQADTPVEAADLQVRLGLVERDCALACIYLDQPQEAEELLLAAVERLGLPEARGQRGQTLTNLGHLYTRMGRYAQALAQFDAATLDLLGTSDAQSAPDRWPLADLLFLEQAALYLALNLLPEAEAALRRALRLLADANQQYELGQAFYLLGVLETRRGDSSAAALDKAAAIFRALDNPYWLHRIDLAQAATALRGGDLDAASRRIDRLLTTQREGVQGSVLAWDQAATCELHLLDAQRSLARGNLAQTNQSLAAAAAALGLSAPEADEPALPYLHISLLHMAGLAARAAGNLGDAHRLFSRAVELVEQQRGLLPIEELRASFLDDKDALYAGLILSLLDLPDAPEGTVAAAFDAVERARSRSLLERLLASVDDRQAASGLPAQTSAQIAAARSRLAWLYNQLLRPGAAGSRGLTPALSDELRACEATLQRLEWQTGDWLQQVQPVTLPQLQLQLAPDQAALVYFIASEEVLAFVVTQQSVKVLRAVTCTDDLDAALAQWRFQLGRVEVGGDYVERRQARLLQGAKDALGRLHELLLAPLGSCLADLAAGNTPVQRLLIIPYGPLHRVPFHALWDGRRYVLEAYEEVAYAASAGLVVHTRRDGQRPSWQTLAALALPDPAIPQAEHEVRAAAFHFAASHLFLGEQAGSDGLQTAAASGDVLHIATHGVFRADNPFFSALKLADGWIDVRAIYRLPLTARLVVLSACESGAVQVQGGDEPIGLGRGFLVAGAQALVISLWNVHDASAALLMDDFYACLVGDQMAPAAALCTAQRHAAEGGRHPFYWASYVAMGE